MDTTEKKVLKGISKNLQNSTETVWREGDLKTWARWAKRMEHCIKDAASLIDDLIEEDEEEQKKSNLTP